LRRESIQHWFWCAALLPACLAVSGCGSADEIAHYQAVRLKQPEVKAVDGMLAAVVLPTGDASEESSPESAAWFFKLAGPVEVVDPQTEPFHKFIKSVHFVDGKPQYDPPADWQARGPSEMRYETFEIPGDKPLQLSVTTLPRGDVDEAEYLLSNINRWRGQLGLRPIDQDHLAEGTVRLTLDGASATLVSLVGKLQQTGMSPPAGPFSGAGSAPGAENGN
jgi:hypothetical protein